MKAAVHWLRYLLGRDQPETQTTQAERNCLASFAANSSRSVELGVFEGVSTDVIARSMSKGILYAVDPFIHGSLGICWSELIARSHANHANVEFLKMTSHQAASYLKGDFDFVFIDADHSLDKITQDWADWSSRLKRGGIIALHDTADEGTFGSHIFFRQTVRKSQDFFIAAQVDSLSVVKRR